MLCQLMFIVSTTIEKTDTVETDTEEHIFYCYFVN